MTLSDAKALAARYWFGYGRWDAPYWFVGMEPGGDDDHSSYEAWSVLDPERDGLIDCRAHHLNPQHPGWQKWHTGDPPPIQKTWGPLIRSALAFEGRSHADLDVARYQRDDWGMSGGNSAIIELSALHARNLEVPVERMLYRPERIAEIRRRLAKKERGFAIFYGVSYRSEYQQIAGTFNDAGWTWSGSTLCVLVVHPAYRFAPGNEYWYELGHWLRSALEAGPHGPVSSRPMVPSARAKGPRTDKSPRSSAAIEGDEFSIVRGNNEVGRILYDQWNVRVERRLPDGGYQLIGFYERTRPQNFRRKFGEIDAIFDNWAALESARPQSVKATWRAAQFVPEFDPPTDAIRSGCAVVEEDGVEVARIFKVLPDRAVWVDRS